MYKLSLLSFSIVLLITGCSTFSEPRVFGVRQSVWNNLSPDQQDDVMDSYLYQKEMEQRQAPINNLIDTTNRC